MISQITLKVTFRGSERKCRRKINIINIKFTGSNREIPYVLGRESCTKIDRGYRNFSEVGTYTYYASSTLKSS